MGCDAEISALKKRVAPLEKLATANATQHTVFSSRLSSLESAIENVGDPDSAALTGAEVQALIDDAIQELPRVQTVTALIDDAIQELPRVQTVTALIDDAIQELPRVQTVTALIDDAIQELPRVQTVTALIDDAIQELPRVQTVTALIDDAIQELPRVQTVTARDIEALRPDVWRDHTTLNINSQNLAAVSWGDRSTNRDTAAVGSAPAVSASGRTNGKCHFAFTAGNYFTTAGTVLKDVFVVCKPAAETGLAVVLSKPSNFYLAACTGSAKRPLYAGPGYQVDGDTLGYRGEFGITEPRIVTFQATDVGGLMSWVSPQQIVAWGANGHRQIYRKYLNGSVVALDFTRIGRYNGGTGDYAGDMICVLGFARCLTQSERAKVMRYLAATYGITLPTYYNMVGLGDSILAHQGVSEAYGLMPRLLGNGGPGLLDATKWSGICGAVGGNRTYDILATNLGTLAAFADDAVNVALIWVGTNNNSTTTVEVALADVAQILAEVRARNGYAVLMAMLPTQAGSESFRIPYNAGLAALAAADEEGTVYFFDGDTLAPDIYDPSPASWSTYYQDGLHPNAAGFGYLAPILAGEIGGFLDGKEPLTLDVATVVVPSGGGGGGTGEAPAASSGFLTFTADDGEAYRVPAEQV